MPSLRTQSRTTPAAKKRASRKASTPCQHSNLSSGETVPPPPSEGHKTEARRDEPRKPSAQNWRRNPHRGRIYWPSGAVRRVADIGHKSGAYAIEAEKVRNC